jgi:long-subunit acyl-CoA synthetase (AMP-forming)
LWTDLSTNLVDNKSANSAVLHADKGVSMATRADFLPAPLEHVLKEGTVKITLALNQKRVDFLQEMASQPHTDCPRMIWNLPNQYIERFSKST